MPTTNGHEVQTGCVLSAPYGWHNHGRLIDVAESLGFPLTNADRDLVSNYNMTGGIDDAEYVIGQGGIMDDAEAWLNANTGVECLTCGQPVQRTDSGAWYVHVGLQGDCPVRMSDSAQHYVWHWTDGEFYLSVLCEDAETCQDETCAHWSFQ
jgi:hypothetical protein